MSEEKFEIEIRKLISLGTEGDYWDFKAEWHGNNSDLLHDIICMANKVLMLKHYDLPISFLL
jgi:hypothetical protein